ncbi:MAG TPA: glycoside hydrolase family 71/99-like protein [Verrucomicrobiae bacterium]|nr:glycoside hydrolase family 71/99-like protein [Verrucomicrobiae bacterium]
MRAPFFQRNSLVCWLLFLTLALSAHAAPKAIMAYYMPWYVAKPHSAAWGWHWTMDHFDPDRITASGEREIASWYYPSIGPYDSADPAVLEYHVLLMKLAGIDGVIVDWYGPDDFLDYGINNQRTAALFEVTRRAGLKFCICFEDQTVQQKIKGGFIKAEDAIPHTQSMMRYLETNYFGDETYLRWNGRPVLLNFGPQYFHADAEWVQILSVFKTEPALFTEDNRLPVGVGAFNWPPMWLSRAPGTRGVLSESALEGYLTGFQQNGRSWPAYISSAFPRFHDVYRKAGMRDYWGYLGDRGGETFRDTLTRALTNDSFIAQIVTWNDYGEGTIVEPTLEYGYRDLEIVQELRRKHLQPAFSHESRHLRLARRLYDLRRVGKAARGELDLIFNAIIAGDLSKAESRLSALERLQPASEEPQAKASK